MKDTPTWCNIIVCDVTSYVCLLEVFVVVFLSVSVAGVGVACTQVSRDPVIRTTPNKLLRLNV